MTVTLDQATTLLENVLFESSTLAAANAPGWVAASAANSSESTVAGLAAAMVASPEASIVEQVVRYYEGALGRAPSGFEIQYYVNIAEFGLTAAQIAAGASSVPLTSWNQIASDFANSPEFAFASAGSSTVILLYLNILNRAPAAFEVAYYNAQLAAGLTATNLIQEFTNSPEFQGTVNSNIASALTNYGSAVANGVTPATLSVAVPVQTMNVTLGATPITVSGTPNTTTVIVTGSPATSAQSAQNAVTGVIGVTGVTAAPGVQPVTAVTAVTPQTAQSAVSAVVDGAVTLSDSAYNAQTAGSITSVTLINSGAGSVINDNALNSLSLTGTVGTLTLNKNIAASSGQPVSLALTVNGLSNAADTITDHNNEITTLNITTTGADSVLAGFVDSGLTTLNLAGTNKLTLGSINSGITALNITGGAGFSDGATVHGTGLASLGANLALSFTSTGSFTAVLDATDQSFTGGSGVDSITVSDLTNATQTITAGSAANNLLILEGGGYALTSASAGKFVNFQTIGVAADVTGSIDLSVIDPAATTVELLGANSSVSFTKVAKGVSLLLQPSSGASVTLSYADSTGATDQASVTMSSNVANLTLQDQLGVGVGSVTIVNNLASNETNVSAAHLISTLTDNGLSNLTVSGSAGLTIGLLNQLTNPATTLTLTNSVTDGYGVTLSNLTDIALATLAFAGSGFSNLVALNDSVASLSITNAGTSLDSVGTLTDSALTSLTLANNISLGQSSSAQTSIGLQDGNSSGVTVGGGSDNSHVTINLTNGAAVGKTDSVTLGNGNDLVVDASIAGTVRIVLGTGANLVELGLAQGDTTAQYSVTLAARSSTAPNVILIGAAGTAYASAPNLVVTGATNGDEIGFGNDAASSATLTTVSLTSAASTAAAIASLEAAATAAHAVIDGVYGGNLYVVETSTGAPGATDTTVVELVGISAITASAGNVTVGGTAGTVSTGTLSGAGNTIPAGTATNVTMGTGPNSITLVGPSTGVTDNFTSLAATTTLTINYQATSGTDTLNMKGSIGSNQSDVTSLVVNDSSIANAGVIIGAFTDNSLTSATYNNSAATGSTMTQLALTSSSLTSINLTGGVAGQATNLYFITANLTNSGSVNIADSNIGSGATTMGLTLAGGPSALNVSMTGPGTLATGALSDNLLTSLTITGSGVGNVYIGTLTDSLAGAFTVNDSSTSTGADTIVLDGLSAATSLTVNDTATLGSLTDSTPYTLSGLTSLSLKNTGAALLTIGGGGISSAALTAIAITGSGTGAITTGAITDSGSGALTITDSDASTGIVTLPLSGMSAPTSLVVTDSAAGNLALGALTDNAMTALSLTNSGSATLSLGAITANALTTMTINDGLSGTITLGGVSDSVAGAFTLNDTATATTAQSVTITSLPNATSVAINDHIAGPLTIGAFTDSNASTLSFLNSGAGLLSATVTDNDASVGLTVTGSGSGTQAINFTDAGATALNLIDTDASTGAVTITPTLTGGVASLSVADSGAGNLTIASSSDANLTTATLTNTGSAILSDAGIGNTSAAGAGQFVSLNVQGSAAISTALTLANTAGNVSVVDSDSANVTLSALNLGGAAGNTNSLTITNGNSGSGTLTVTGGSDYLTSLTVTNNSLGSTRVTLTNGASALSSVTLSGNGPQTLTLTDNSGPVQVTETSNLAITTLSLTHNGISNDSVTLGNGTNNLTLADSTAADVVAVTVGTGINSITFSGTHNGPDILNFSTSLGLNANTAPVTADMIRNFTTDSATAQGDTITLGFAGANIITATDANSGAYSLWTSSSPGMLAKTGASVLNFIADIQSLTQAGSSPGVAGIAGFSDGTNTWIAYNDASGSHVSVIELVGVVASGIEASGTTANFIHVA